ncbi:hypothetical protein K438DRAFT_1748450 [Mycena galopus ATCC 62051]|nr:hypothetical protein K438DRAFT_1748450 [Mycena galopus ATCC 62051]
MHPGPCQSTLWSWRVRVGTRGRHRGITHSDWSVDALPPVPLSISESRAEYWERLCWNQHQEHRLLRPQPHSDPDPDCDLPSASHQHPAPFPFTAGALMSWSNKAGGKRPSTLCPCPCARLCSAWTSPCQRSSSLLVVSQVTGRRKEHKLAVNPVPLHMSTSAFSIASVDVNKALFVASGLSIPGAITNAAEGLHGPIDIHGHHHANKALRYWWFHDVASIDVNKALFVISGLSISGAITNAAEGLHGRGPTVPSILSSLPAAHTNNKSKQQELALDHIPAHVVHPQAHQKHDRGCLWLQCMASVVTEKEKNDRQVKGCRHLTDKACDNGSTSVQVVRRWTKTGSGIVSILAVTVKDIRNINKGSRVASARLRAVRKMKGLAVV